MIAVMVLVLLLRSGTVVAEVGRTDGEREPVLLGESPRTDPVRGQPVPAATGFACKVLGSLAYPILMPLSGGGYGWTDWSRDRRQCNALLGEAGLGLAALGVGAAGHPRRPAVFGAGSFDRFFRDSLRSRSKVDNFFEGDLGSLYHPLFATGAVLLASVSVAGAHGYRDSLARAVPLLWLGVAGNTFPTQIAKKSFGRERPYLKFDNRAAIHEFGTGDDARKSFYSGHASTAFFSAAFMDRVLADVIQSSEPEYALRSSSPWKMRLIRLGQAGLLYGLAAGVAYSRIEIDQHYMTDVLAGGFAGAVHGHLLYQFGYRRRSAPHALSVSVTPRARSVIVAWLF